MTPFQAIDTICLVAIAGFIVGECISRWSRIRQAIAPVHNQPVHNLVEPEPAPLPQATPLTDEDFVIIGDWARLNPWYSADAVLNLEAQHVHMALRSLHPDQALIDNLAAVTVEMHRRHPEIVPTKQ